MIHIEGFDPSSPPSNPAIDRFEFDDGALDEVLLGNRNFDGKGGTPVGNEFDLLNGRADPWRLAA